MHMNPLHTTKPRPGAAHPPPHHNNRGPPLHPGLRPPPVNSPQSKSNQLNYSTKKLAKLFGVDEKIVEKAQLKPSIPSRLKRMYSNVDLQMKRRRGPNEGGSPMMGAMPSVTSPIHVVGNPMTKPRSSPVQVNSKRVSPDEEEITSYLNPLLEMLLNCMDIQENSLAAQQGGRPPSLTTASPNNTNGSNSSVPTHSMSRSFGDLHDAAAADPFQRDKKRKPPPPPLSVSGGSLPTRNPPAFNFDDGLEEKTSDAKPSAAARRQLSPKLKGPPPLPPTSSGSNISPPSSLKIGRAHV